ncbi:MULTISPECIES: tyrosine-type recombinase/integrase [Hafnia]|uniref:Tyrosine recombinase n=2 Tax=Hafnia alvei TaxID=569 RepID=A0A377TIS4_HAFAL
MPNRRYLTESEVHRLLVAAKQGRNPERDCCLIWMCYIHGCRVSEISHWRLSDVDFASECIYIHRLKNGFSTIHPLYPIEKEVLFSWIAKRSSYKNAESDWVFLSRNGNRISRQVMTPTY